MPYIDGDGYIVGDSGGTGSNTITRASDDETTLPLLILGYQTRMQGRSVVTDLLDGGIAVTLVKPRPRSGTLQLLYADSFSAWAAVALHQTVDTFNLVSTEQPDINMDYIVTGVAPALEDQTRQLWEVSIEYQEIDL